MSIINRMLQELDRRQGLSDPNATQAVPQVRSVPPPRKDREWFWRIIAVLMVAAVGWVGWLAWQLRPHQPVATDQAFKAAENARRQPAAVAPVSALQKPAVPKPAPAPAAPKPAPEQATPVAAAEPSAKPDPRAAEAPAAVAEIQAKSRERPAKPSAKEQAKRASAPTPKPAAKLDLDVPPARILQAPARTPARVEKRDRVRSAEDRAETEFRRGAALLNQGRAGEAEESFAAALNLHPAHEAARQALVALRLEQRRIDEARRLLQEGVALHPGNARFAAVLARILVERKDYLAALEVLNGVRSADQGDAELQLMRATALQRLGRNAEAAEAFQMSLRGAPHNGAAWMGLGISLEAVGKNAEAADAFRRAAAAGTLGVEARGYAEQRARQLQ